MSNPFNPDNPASDFRRFLPGGREASAGQPRWTPADGPMPAIYLSHGAPPLYDDAEWIDQLAAWAHSMPKPTGIVIVSAHWEAAPISISDPTAGTPLVYDFYGFHPTYYDITYPTPDATLLADEVKSLMPDTSPVHEHAGRGLDHGAWVPLSVMYPLGDVPVIQVSMPTNHPDQLMALGRRLRPLRDEGVLIIGSGFMTHGLPYLTPEMIQHGRPAPWSSEFDAWAADALERGDIEELAAYRNRAPGVRYAHPTVEHYTPLFVAVGAGAEGDLKVRTAIDGYMVGLSKRSFEVV